jgi:hypothetical protein
LQDNARHHPHNRHAGAMLMVGQERSKDRTALAAEPCRASDSNSHPEHQTLTEFQTHTTTPKGRLLLMGKKPAKRFKQNPFTLPRKNLDVRVIVGAEGLM